MFHTCKPPSPPELLACDALPGAKRWVGGALVWLRRGEKGGHFTKQGRVCMYAGAGLLACCERS
jgi:hypothetical protein